MISKPPIWYEILKTEGGNLLDKCFKSKELQDIIQKARDNYVYWDIFRYYRFPDGIKPEEAWAFLKISSRTKQETSPIKVKNSNNYFGFSYPKSLFCRLSYIDIHSAGFIKTLSNKPNSIQKDQLIISGLSEEAIASSQIEGANTSRKVAKEMIYSGRKPRNRDEQMIINNYQVMQFLDEIKDLPLTEDILLDIQKRITKNTLDDDDDTGRFRTDVDNIVVSDRLTGDITYIPPKEEEMRRELKKLIDFANNDKENESGFIHPVIKAAIIHFWIAYLHPFVDGNGRTARALFYWYLIKRDYWLFQYLSISRIIKAEKKKYDNAFIHSEYDDSDLTYFLLFITEVTCKSIEDMIKHYERKVKETEEYRKITEIHKDFNERQVALLSYSLEHPQETIDLKTHQAKHGIVYETARKDLNGLLKKGLFIRVKKGFKYVYVPNIKQIKKIF